MIEDFQKSLLLPQEVLTLEDKDCLLRAVNSSSKVGMNILWQIQRVNTAQEAQDILIESLQKNKLDEAAIGILQNLESVSPHWPFYYFSLLMNCS